MKFKVDLKLIIILFSTASLCTSGAFAAGEDDVDVLNLEDIYKKDEVQVPAQTTIPVANEVTTAPTESTENTTPATTDTGEISVVEGEKIEEIKVRELKDLNKLVPFSEISVIQKKYMPKAQRFQFFAGLSLATNTPWYGNYGGKLNLSYNFTEVFGIELSTLFLTSSARDVVKDIKTNNDVEADQFIYTKGYYGIDVMWSPVYGKVSFNEKKIINYEMYFAAGVGLSNTQSQEKNVTTVHIGTGQIFAITKSMAFRWDYGINIFQATPLLANSSGKLEKSTYNDLILTAGVSFFFPEATYR